MPAKSEKQRRFMAAVANNPKFAKEVGVPQAVGEEFMKAKKMFLGGLFSSKKEDDDKPMTMTQRKAEEAKKRATAAQMRSESKARRGRTASTTAVGGQRNKQQAPMDAERAANMAMVKKDNPMPKRPATNAATPKPTRPAKPQKEPTTAPRPPKGEAPAKPMAKKPPRPLRGTVTGKGGRNVGEGQDKRANVTREQLQETGMTLRQYLNFMDKEGKRPPKKSGVDKVPNKRDPRKKYAGGGMMKSKGYAKGGAMKTKGYKAGGKVRGAGIARKGVRPAKMR
jgi:hypothetical protein